MSGSGTALRLDDVGAASKRHEVYGVTRVALGPLRLRFPGNLLFLKRLPPIKRWGPYRELGAAEWETILGALEGAGARMTAAITAGWVEDDGRVVPYPQKFPAAAAVVRAGVRRGLLEVANHGYTHCVLAGRLFRPRAFAGNRQYHREFLEWVPAETHRAHLSRAQAILEDYFGAPVVTFVPPGNAFTRATLAAALEVGLRYVSCRDAGRWGDLGGLVGVDDADVVALHDRDLVLGGLGRLRDLLAGRAGAPFVTVRDVAERLAGGRR